jgi:hypothetical protein
MLHCRYREIETAPDSPCLPDSFSEDGNLFPDLFLDSQLDSIRFSLVWVLLQSVIQGFALTGY